jgi:hypothetical protein
MPSQKDSPRRPGEDGPAKGDELRIIGVPRRRWTPAQK